MMVPSRNAPNLAGRKLVILVNHTCWISADHDLTHLRHVLPHMRLHLSILCLCSLDLVFDFRPELMHLRERKKALAKTAIQPS